MSICIYPSDCDDFSTNGLGVLTPSRCTVSEESGGMFELELEQPIDSTLRWAQLAPGCILKAPAPTRESPLYETEGVTSGLVTRNVWKVTGTKSGLGLYNKASGKRKKLTTLRNGALVNEIGRSGAQVQVVAQNGGRKGWVKDKYLAEAGTVTENVWNGQIVHPVGVAREQSREQLFRVYSVERDAAAGVVTAKAMHISYDLRATLVNSAYEVEKKTEARAVLEGVWSRLATEHAFELHVVGEETLRAKITGDFGWKNPIECMMDPDEGILAQTGALLLRDNFDLFVVPDAPRDSGVTIRRGKNLKAVSVTTDASDLVTRIIPVGKTKDGSDLFLTGENYVDSPRVGDYPFPYVQKIDYDVKVVDKDADNETTFPSAAKAREKLKALAEADFAENGVDLPSYGMEVDFVLLQNSAEYANYAALQAVYLNDTVTVIDSTIGLTAKLRVTGYEWDALRLQYDKVTLGDVESLDQVVYSYNLPDGGVKGTKIAPGSVPGTALRNATIEYAKIAVAAIEQLSANSITALTARIQQIVSQSMTTDELYAALASLNRAVIEHANIQWANIETLQAAVAAMAQASIGTADIGWAQIKDLITGTAIITEGVGGKLMISRLAVTEANMVSLTTGELVVKGKDGRFYAVTVDEEGNVQTELKQVSNDDVTDLSIDAGEKLIEGSVTAACLNATDIFADNAVIRKMIAANLDVDTLFGREAFITLLRTSHIVGDQTLEMVARDSAAAATAQNGIGAIWNDNSFSGGSTPEGEALILYRDPATGKMEDKGGWVWWNGVKRTIPRILVNPNQMCPYNVTIYIVARLSSANATDGATARLVWYDGGWKSGNVDAGVNAAVSAWTWAEATDIVLGSFVEPGADVALVDCALYTPCRTSRQLTTGQTARQAAQQTTKDALDSLQLGGTNILRGTNAPRIASGGWPASAWARTAGDASCVLATAISVSDAPSPNITGGMCITNPNGVNTWNGISQQQIPAVIGQTYTLSCYARLTKGAGNCQCQYDVTINGAATHPSKSAALTTKWTKYAYTYTVPATATNNYFGAAFYLASTTGETTMEICGMQLELGGKATDWSPAPEDVDAAIDGTSEQIGEVSSRVDSCVTSDDPGARDLDTYMRLVAGKGVYVGYKGGTAQAFIDATGWFRVLINGVSVTAMGPNRQEIGDLAFYKTSTGSVAVDFK